MTHNWIKQNQKRLMAVFGAFLMVAFLWSGPMNRSGPTRRRVPAAHVGKTVIYRDEIAAAERQWQLVGHQRFLLSFAYRKLGDLTYQMLQNPKLFFLLQKEAEQRGIRIPDDNFKSVAVNELGIQLPAQSGQEEILDLLHGILLVQALRDEVADADKLSEPELKQRLIVDGRKIRLNVVEYSAEQSAVYTPAPTTQQVQSTFDDYKNVSADSSADGLGFGYQVPPRVKLQYVSIPRQRVADAVRAKAAKPDDKPGDVPFELREKAYIYYLEHQQKYTVATTQPTTLPTSGPATSVASTSPAVPSTTTRPFEQVQADIVAEVIKPDVDQLQEKIVAAIQLRMYADYAAYLKSPTSQPATLPTTIAGAPTTMPSTIPSENGYASYGYLQALAQDILAQFGVLPDTTQVGEWQDSKALALLPGIGHASEPRAFAQYALQSSSFGSQSEALQLWQPSEKETDASNNAFIFRLTASSPAHMPDFAEVKARVEDDAHIKASYTAANLAAQKFLEAAKKSTFARAALDDQRSIIRTDPFNPATDREIPNYHASASATSDLTRAASDLLAQASAANPNPITTVAIPSARKVVVVQLDSVLTILNPDRAQRVEMEHLFRAGSSISETYFAYDAVAQRIGYVEDAKADSGS